MSIEQIPHPHTCILCRLLICLGHHRLHKSTHLTDQKETERFFFLYVEWLYIQKYVILVPRNTRLQLSSTLRSNQWTLVDFDGVPDVDHWPRYPYTKHAPFCKPNFPQAYHREQSIWKCEIIASPQILSTCKRKNVIYCLLSTNWTDVCSFEISSKTWVLAIFWVENGTVIVW